MATEVASNEDLLREVLLCLPVKALLRFKCVSKRWLALISEPRFCHSHTLRQYNGTRPFPSALLLGNTTDTNASSLSCPIIPLKCSGFHSSSNFRYVKVPGMSITIMQSCNGLLLLQGRPLKCTDFPFEVSHFVYNPTTNQFVAINFPSPFGQFGSSIFLSFEPSRSPYYKVISIRSSGFLTSSEHEFVVNVYSSETGSWSDPGVCFNDTVTPIAVYCNGAIYWYSDAMNSKYFDVENQCFETFPMPLGIQDQKVSSFGESGGHLHLVVRYSDFLDVLELNEDRSGWSLKFLVKLYPMRVVYPRFGMSIFNTDCCIVRQENEVDSMLVFFIDGSVIACNLVNSTSREIGNFSSCWIARWPCGVFHYYENLSWVGPSHN